MSSSCYVLYDAKRTTMNVYLAADKRTEKEHLNWTLFSKWTCFNVKTVCGLLGVALKPIQE
ncbi:CLUMA_CG012457, isoform A [Clunio marinus]|uniref:CLUMA_CG012457, isoform A n=1 Tax=Clunio marinus TaxID=568069 RepID=A0A1J1IEM6_9DIPT|nr:CLUMA_CG012457, isoform A [Clunio marinus]